MAHAIEDYEEIRQQRWRAARLEMMLAACVHRLGDHVVFEADDFDYRLTISENGNDLRTDKIPFPLVKGKDLGASFRDEPTLADLLSPAAKDAMNHDEPVGGFSGDWPPPGLPHSH